MMLFLPSFYNAISRFFCLLFLCCSFIGDCSINTVEHKNVQLNLYLDNIRYNIQEKIGILPYILRNPEGTYLEIGTGGDPIATMLDKIPDTSRTKLIASDIDERILQSLPMRHPSLKRYIDSEEGPCLYLQQLNAVDMHVFEDEMLDGINASSVLHEIISYAGGFDAMQQFFQEAFRTLKQGGVLVYRDPESVINKTMSVSVNLKNKSIRLFAHVFLYKFLDSAGSALARSGKKTFLYKTEDVYFTVYKKNECNPTRLTYKEYLSLPSYDIDFSRTYILTVPLGLYRELARHYLTYLHVCNPLMFVQCVPAIQSSVYAVHHLAHSTADVLNHFLTDKHKIISNGTIDLITKSMIDQEIDRNTQVLEFGIPLHFNTKDAQHRLRLLLKQYGFDPGRHIITISSNDFLLDYRMFGMLFDEISAICDKDNVVLDQRDILHAAWLKREGEEYYFYLSADELIAQVLSITYQAASHDNVGDELCVLCPLSAEDNIFIDRLCYTELLNNSLEVYDAFGYTIPVQDGKRVINFGKMSIREAIAICEHIVNKDPLAYPCTKAWLTAIKQ